MDLLSSSLINSIAIALLSIIILFLFLHYHYRPSNSKEPPLAPGAWPILGHLIPLFAANSQKPPHKILGSLADQYGPLFTIKLGTARAVVLSNWEMAKECFTTNDIIVSSRPTLIATQQMGYNGAMFGLAPYGPYWRELRKIITLEILSGRRVEQLGHVRVSEVQTSINELYYVWCSKKNEESGYMLVELKQWFTEVTFNMVLRMAVGKRYIGGGDVVEERCMSALRKFMRLMGLFTVGDAVPWMRWFDFGGHVKEMKETAKELDRVVGEWLEEHRRLRAMLGEKVDRDDEQDFMDIMISLVDGTIIDGFDGDTIIKATVLTLFLGGAETTTVTLTWAICLLLKNPHILEKAKEELNTKVGKDKCISESDLSKLVYLQAIVKETLRLCPPGPLSAPREFSENCTLGSYQVKKGTRLITNLWKINTDASVWPDPLDFRPERFLTTHKDVDVRGHHFELLPFGCGRRICPGISFGLQMVHFTLASFLHSFEILNPSGEHVDMTESFGLTNAKATPLEVLVKPSLSTNCYETM
ncbi:cytochrome P450 82A4-like [Lotus japonicus]|uniref:cytochrome P450 82A4-like n=1 Tax=Lotus japonicus TaxID=34305 RepID=UPI00258E2A27|nr:cytochrome P450 82A4-like [Lotus japonicus]